ncbi:MAG: YjgN family protein [Hyphomicrobiales bacterium]
MDHPIKFSGNAKEYFVIWIVNIFLNIVTLGIYSAWAKVRTNRYFYGNTSIDGHAFDYHATGKQILIGRIIVVAALIAFQLLTHIAPIAGLILLVIYLGLFPWLIVKGLQFSRRMTSYRNVRFDFKGTYGGAFWAFIALPFLNIFTIYLITPFVSRTLSQFVANNSRYGDRDFGLEMPIAPLYKIFAIILTTVLILVAIYGWIALQSGLLSWVTDGITNIGTIVTIYATLIPAFIIFGLGYLAYNVVVRNTLYNHLVLDNKHSFGSTLSIRRYAFIAVTNAIVMALTLGLMSPWAKVRMARYISSQTTVSVNGSLSEYASSVQSSSGVVGSEFMDIEGVDVGLGA